MMYEDQRPQFSDPARQLEFDLARHTLRLHYDSLMMIVSSLLVVGTGGGVTPLVKEVESLADRICKDLDALEDLLPESLEMDELAQVRLDPTPPDAPRPTPETGAEPTG